MDCQSSIDIPAVGVVAQNANDHEFEASPDNSPISCLSEELLTLILDIVRQSFDGPNDSVARAKVPIMASHVSKFWRFCVLENPLWWSNIVIVDGWKIAFVEACLQRSKQCLLDIRFVKNDRYDETPKSEVYQRLLHLLLPHFPRCRALDTRRVFNSAAGIPFYFLKRLLDTDMPYLEKLILCLNPHYYYDELSERRTRPLFPSSPLLRDLRLIGIGIQQFSMPQDAPLASAASLKSLHLSTIGGNHCTTFAELKTVLQSCPSLAVLAIYGDLLSHGSDPSISCDVPSLESIYILGNMLRVSELLVFLVAPNLKELIIAPFVPSDLDLLFSQSESNSAPNQHRFSALRSLTLATANEGAFEALERASACFAQVEYLILPNLNYFDFTELFTYKGVDGDADVLFPNLRDLALMDLDGIHYQAIRDVQVFRAQQRHPLRTVYIDSESFELIMSEYMTEGEPFDLDVVEGNLWEAQMKRLLHTEFERSFIGQTS